MPRLLSLKAEGQGIRSLTGNDKVPQNVIPFPALALSTELWGRKKLREKISNRREDVNVQHT
jgi:hypothetical protein